MFKDKKKTCFLLGIIFVVALFLRFFNLSSFPVGFHQDEASLGYNGYSLLLTGRDDNNKPWPLYIDVFGDNRPSGYHYLTILPIKFFGLNEFATRFPGALFGSLTVFVFFLLTMSIFQNKKLALLSALLIAIAPWHVVLSRASAEAIIALFFIILGFSLIMMYLKKGRLKYLLSGSLFLSLSYFFYHIPRVFIPLLFLAIITFFFLVLKRETRNKRTPLILSLIWLFSLALILVFVVPGGSGRYSQVNIFTSFETDFFQKQQIQEDAITGSTRFVSRFFHNKLSNVFLIFTSNYLDYFGLNFLFTKGGLPIWYSIPRIGLIYLVELPLILIGVYYLIRDRSIYSKIPLIWLLLGPVVAAITMDDVPNINRSIVMFPMLELIAAVGSIAIFNNLKSNRRVVFLMIVVILFLLNISYFLHQYFYNAKAHDTWYRNNGFAEMMEVVKKSYANYDAIIMSKYQGGIYPLVLFYMRYNPSEYQAAGSPKDKDYGGFGKFIFVPQDCPSVQKLAKTEGKKRILYVDRGDCRWEKSPAYKKYSFIYREDKTAAFRLVYE